MNPPKIFYSFNEQGFCAFILLTDEQLNGLLQSRPTYGREQLRQWLKERYERDLPQLIAHILFEGEPDYQTILNTENEA